MRVKAIFENGLTFHFYLFGSGYAGLGFPLVCSFTDRCRPQALNRQTPEMVCFVGTDKAEAAS